MKDEEIAKNMMELLQEEKYQWVLPLSLTKASLEFFNLPESKKLQEIFVKIMAAELNKEDFFEDLKQHIKQKKI